MDVEPDDRGSNMGGGSLVYSEVITISHIVLCHRVVISQQTRNIQNCYMGISHNGIDEMITGTKDFQF